MSDTQQLAVTGASSPEPPPGGGRRAVVRVLALAAAFALGALFVTIVHDYNDSKAATQAATRPRNSGDPVAPQKRATLDPRVRSDAEAAVRGNWPLLLDDEFDGNRLDPTYWQPYSGETTGGVGRHNPDNLSVSAGMLSLTSKGKQSAGLAWSPGQMYGRWEVRARSQVGTGYGPVLLLWPDAEDWPEGGEIDFMEIPKPERKLSSFTVHFGEDNSQNGVSVPNDFTQWHNFAVEWTPDHVAGFVDGQEVFRSTDRRQIPPRPMHLALQQDIGPYGTDWIPPLDDSTPPQVQFQIDWVRIYSL